MGLQRHILCISACVSYITYDLYFSSSRWVPKTLHHSAHKLLLRPPLSNFTTHCPKSVPTPELAACSPLLLLPQPIHLLSVALALATN